MQRGIRSLLLLLLLSSCSSPLELDTPRDRIVEEELPDEVTSTKVPATSIKFIYFDDFSNPNEDITLDVIKMEGIIDTTENRLWLHGTWKIPQNKSGDASWWGVSEVTIETDSIDLLEPSFNLTNQVGTDSVRILFKGGPLDFEFFPDGTIDWLKLESFLYNPTERSIRVPIKGRIRPYGRTSEFSGSIEITY